MININKLHELVKEAGFGAAIVLGYPQVNVYNHNDEWLGAFVVQKNDTVWFFVYDPEKGLSPEGGECGLTVDAIKDIVGFFSYR